MSDVGHGTPGHVRTSFCALVWLLEHEPANVDEQVATLRALVTVAKERPVTLSAEGSQIGGLS
jgi:hypothetical protein